VPGSQFSMMATGCLQAGQTKPVAVKRLVILRREKISVDLLKDPSEQNLYPARNGRRWGSLDHHCHINEGDESTKHQSKAHE
jgi:hypothetical protein